MHTKFQGVKVVVLLMLVGVLSLFFFTIGFADAPTSEDGMAAPAAVPTAPPLYTYASSSSSGSAGGVQFGDEDIIRYNSATGTWEKFFDGSSVGLEKVDVDSFQLKPTTALNAAALNFVILMTFDKDIKNVPGLGKVRSNDIVQFAPTSIGPNTAGTFSFFLQGDLAGLNNKKANIDAFTFAPDGRLVVSLADTVNLSGLTVGDEDLIVRSGETTWGLYLDGSAFQLAGSKEGIDGAWIDPTGDHNIYISTKGNYKVASGATSLSGDGDDFFGISPSSATLPIIAGFLFPSFNGDTVGLKKNLDGIFVDFTGAIGGMAALDGINAAGVDEAAVVQYEVSSEAVEGVDSEIEEFDAAEEDDAADALNNRLFVPVAFTK